MAPTDDMLVTAFDDGGRRPEPPMQPCVGRYVLLDRLGAGGMGTVFLAHDPELDRKVAIKLLRGGSSEAAQVRMQREAQAMARVSHVNVATVFDVGRFGDEVFLAMEYVAGGTLDEWLEIRQRSWREILDLFVAAGRGLAAAHAVDLVHRDFKPATVLLGPDGVAKVTDFGLVRVADAASDVHDDASDHTNTNTNTDTDTDTDTDTNRQADSISGDPPAGSSDGSVRGSSSSRAFEIQLTRVGKVLGTPAYMSPEQVRGATADARSDQFSFCVALHEALWGVSPFCGSNIETRMRNVLEDRRVPRPAEREVPAWLEPIVDRGLSPDPDARWPSMDALLAVLADDPAVRRQRRRRWLLAGGLSVALGLGLWVDVELDEARCEAAAREAHTLWAARAPSLETEDWTAGPAYAESNIQRVRAGVDDWVARWADVRGALCRERTSGSAGAGVAADQTERCLAEQLDALSSLLIVLDERAGTTGIVAHAITAVGALPDPASCTDEGYAAFHAHDCAPELSLALHRIQALERAGLDQDGLDAAERLLDGPELRACPTIDDQVLVLAARLEVARSPESQTHAADRATKALRRANHRGDLRLARAASATLARVAQAERRFEAALVWIETMALFDDRLGAQPELVIETELARAEVLFNMGAYQREAEVLGALDRLVEDTLDPRHPTRLRYFRAAARLKFARGDRLATRVLLEQAATMAAQLYGPDHPEHLSLLLHLATLEPDPTRGLERTRAVLARSRAKHGDDSLEAAIAAERVAMVHLVLSQNEQARDQYAALLPRLGGIAHVPVAEHARALNHYGIALRRTKDLDGAERALRAALERLEAALGPEHPDLSDALVNLANVVEERGRVTEAVNLQRRALALGADQPDSPGRALLLNNMGRLELELGHDSQAMHDLERAAKIGRAMLPADDLNNIDYLTDLALAKLANQGPGPAGELFDQLIERCDSHPQPDNEECTYTRSLAAQFLLDHRPQSEARALALSTRSMAVVPTLGTQTDAWLLRFIHLRALARTGARALARDQRDALVDELLVVPGNRHRTQLLRELRAWDG